MALPYATENQLKQVTKSEVTKAINPILATGSIRKKPYVEKVVESLSSESLELLRETLNTNKDNVNVSLVGGSNLLKKFEKEYIGTAPSTEKYNNGITLYFNIEGYKTYDDFLAFFNKVGTPISSQGMIVKMLTDDVETGSDDNIELLKPQNENIKAILVSAGFGGIFGFVNDETSFNASLTYLKTQPGLSTLTGTWNGTGWYKIENYTKNPTIVKFDSNINRSFTIIQFTVDGLGEFISDTPFKTNTQLIGHIPQVGDVVEKVYFNPDAYSTDSEWKLWYEGLKGINKKNPENKFLLSYSAETSEFTILVTNHYEFNGLDLINILLLDLGNQFLGYVTNEALTGSQSAVWTQLGVTETGWYKTGGTEQAPTFTKVSNILENSYLNATIFGIVGNEHLFSKVLSFNETFTETPVQNLLKPNPIQVGQEVNKIYINLGYFDNDLNKMSEFHIDKIDPKLIFKTSEGDFFYIFDEANGSGFYMSKNLAISKGVTYLNQQAVTYRSLGQEYVNKWVAIHRENNETIIDEIIDTDVYEYEIEGTITELGDTSLISFNKPFTEIGGYIYEDVTPVTLELEKDLNQDGILIWDDTQCVLLAYYPYKNLIDIFVIDPENYTYEKLSESATIEELRRVVFTPTQEDTALNINNLSLEEDEVIFDKVFKSSDLENSGKTLLVGENSKLFDINAVYKAQSELEGTEFQLYAKPINKLEIEFNAVITQAQGDITEIKLWVELSNDLSHYVISSLAILNILSTSDATVQTQVFNFFKFAMDNEEATLPIKLTRMKYVSK